MVQVTVTASVKVAGGPTMPLSTTLAPLSYTFASVTLDESGGANASRDVDLLPDGGAVVLLGLTARTAAGQPAEVAVTPSFDAATTGSELTVAGTLLVANSGVLAALVAGGPRTLGLTNPGAEPVTVDILTGLEASA